MSWEDVSNSFDHTRPEDILISLDLQSFGELVGRVATETHRVNGLEEFAPGSLEAQHLVIDAWRYVCHMKDRLEFEKSVAADLASLDAPNAEPQAAPSSMPTHLPEFGGAAPLPTEAPKELERRLEPPA